MSTNIDVGGSCCDLVPPALGPCSRIRTNTHDQLMDAREGCCMVAVGRRTVEEQRTRESRARIMRVCCGFRCKGLSVRYIHVSALVATESSARQAAATAVVQPYGPVVNAPIYGISPPCSLDYKGVLQEPQNHQSNVSHGCRAYSHVCTSTFLRPCNTGSDPWCTWHCCQFLVLVLAGAVSTAGAR